MYRRNHTPMIIFAIILAIVVVLIFFVGLLLLYTDHPILTEMGKWFQSVVNKFHNLF